MLIRPNLFKSRANLSISALSAVTCITKVFFFLSKTNGLNFLPPSKRELSNENLSKLINEATVYLECYMTVAKIKKLIAKENNRKAFFSEFK